MKSYRILFLTDWSTLIGSGHYQRCKRLATAFDLLGHQTEIVLNQDNCDIETSVKKLNWLKHELPYHLYDLIIIDSYFITDKYIEEISKNNDILIIDDNKLLNYKNVAILNPNLHAESLNYDASNILLIGANFCLSNLDTNKNDKTIKKVENILITFGGTDPQDETIKVIKKLNLNSLLVHVIIGPNFSKKQVDELNNLAINNKNVRLISGLDQLNLYEKICEADVVISATGQTTYEIINSKTPGFFCKVADNQRLIYKYLQDNDLDLGINIKIEEIENSKVEDLKRISNNYNAIADQFRKIDVIAKDIIEKVK